MGIAAYHGSQGQVDSTSAVGAKLVRVEFPITATVDDLRPVIAGQAAHGARVLPLAGFAGRIPTSEEARNLGTWAHAYGPGGTFWIGRTDGELAVTRIEFGNETSYGYQYGDQYDQPSYLARAHAYALRFKDAQEAIQSLTTGDPLVGLLAQADDAGTGSPVWVNGMFEAVPDLAARVAGWTIHPYGPIGSWQPRIDRLIAQTAARGASASIPIDITEWGLSTDDGRCVSDNYGWDRCMSYQTAATTLHATIGAMKARYDTRLQMFVLYMITDLRPPGATTDRESYFGALTSTDGEKGAYTREVRAQLAGTA